MKEDILKISYKVLNGIQYITYYINRPIREGDPQGGSEGTSINGIDKTTKIINFIYTTN